MSNFENVICQNCQSKNSIIIMNINNQDEEPICEKCGAVSQEKIIDYRYEKRIFENDERNDNPRVERYLNTKNGNECGVNLVFSKNGKEKKTKSSPKLSKIEKNFIKIKKLLSSVNAPKK